MQTAREPSRNDRFAEEGEDVDSGAPVAGKTSVPVQFGNGEVDVDVPQISRSKRGREQKINELGYRMAWGQGRVFSGRPIFLARACESAFQRLVPYANLSDQWMPTGASNVVR